MGQSCASSTGLYLLPPGFTGDPATTNATGVGGDGDGGGGGNTLRSATSLNDNPFAEHHWQSPSTAAAASSFFASSSFRSGKTLSTAGGSAGGGGGGGPSAASGAVFSSAHHPHLPAWDLPTILIRETAIGDTSWPHPPYVTDLLQRLSPLEVQFFLVRLLLPLSVALWDAL